MLDRFAFTSMTGAKHAMGQLANTASNLANVQTPGFREMLSTFRAVPVQGGHSDSRAFVVDSTPGADFSAGAMNTTGNPLDVAIKNHGFFSVMRADGSEGYTRAGKFSLDANGILRSAGQLAVVGESGEIRIPPGTHSLQIRDNGAIYGVMPGEDSPVRIDALKLVNEAPHALKRAGDGLFEASQNLQHDPDVKVATETLEMSNVNVAEAMVQMIQQNRLFDLNIRMVQAAEQNSKTAGMLVSLSRS